MDTFGISRDHIFNSRDTSFLPAIKAATNGRGVDVVLNSLSGELLHASWECVAEYGSMVEIGKRDFIGKAQLNMDLFESNRSFFGVDLAKFDGVRCQLWV
jgi:NADPH:quinone reductase-like Zn-dependent oxidoreductase